MTTPFVPVVLVACALSSLGLAGLTMVLRRKSDPLDTETEERWLMRHMPQRLVPLARVLDRRILGGIAAVVTMSVVFVGALVVGWLLDSVGRNSGFAAFDESAAQWGAENATEGSTKILRAITLLGASPVIALLAALVGAAVARRRRFGPLGYLTVVCGGVFLLNNALKLLVHRSRPDIGRRTTAAGWSFPSGHSATAAAGWAAIALVLLSRSSRRWRKAGAFAALVVTVAVACSRVLLGVHWLTDVIAGITVGWSWFLVVTVIFGGRLLRFGEPAERVSEVNHSRTVREPCG